MSLSYGLLGLLNYFPMSGYDLKKIFEDSINFFWAAQTSQIYRELKGLEKSGCVAAKNQASKKGPTRRVYHITSLGKTRLREWITNPPDDVGEDQRNAFLIRVLHSSQVGFKSLYPQVQARLAAYQRELQQLDGVEQQLKVYLERSGHSDNLPYWQIVLSRGRHVTRANIDWANETLRLIEGFLKKGKA